MKFLILSLGLTIALFTSSDAVPKCHSSELGACIDIIIQWMHSLPKRSLPGSQEDVNRMCQEMDRSIDCVFKFRDNCMTPIHKEVIAMVSEGLTVLKKDFCEVGSTSQSTYLKHAPCINDIAKSAEIKETIDYAIAMASQLQTISHNEKITFFCCGYGKLFNSLVDIIADKCGEEAADAGLNLLNIALAQLPEIVCKGYKGDEEECVAVMPPKGAKIAPEAQATPLYRVIHILLKNWLD